MQTWSVNPEFHRESTNEPGAWDPSKNDLEKRSSTGISKTYVVFTAVPSYDLWFFRYGVAWEEIWMLNIFRVPTSEPGYWGRLGFAQWHVLSVLHFFHADTIISPGSRPVSLDTGSHWGLQSNTCPLYCVLSMQIWSVNLESHYYSPKAAGVWDLSKSGLEKQSSMGRHNTMSTP